MEPKQVDWNDFIWWWRIKCYWIWKSWSHSGTVLKTINCFALSNSFFAEKCNRFEHPKTEAGAVGVDENVFLFGGFDHNRRANFGKNTTLGADEQIILKYF